MLNLKSGDRVELFYEDSPATTIRATVARLLTDRDEGMGIEVEDYIACWAEITVDEPGDGDVTRRAGLTARVAEQLAALLRRELAGEPVLFEAADDLDEGGAVGGVLLRAGHANALPAGPCRGTGGTLLPRHAVAP